MCKKFWKKTKWPPFIVKSLSDFLYDGHLVFFGTVSSHDIFWRSTQSGIIIKPYNNTFVTILVHFNEVIPDKLFFWRVIHGGHLEFKCDLDLEYRKYFHYLREHVNSLSKIVIPSILDTYNKIIRGKRHYFINFWQFFSFFTWRPSCIFRYLVLLYYF